MENVLIILAVVVGIGFNLYNNYKKEMEKNAKRVIRVPKASTPPTPVSVEVKHDYTHSAPSRVPIEHIPNEVYRMKQERAKKKAPAISIQPSPQKEVEFEFDLRQAIIQTVILERPYKY